MTQIIKNLNRNSLIDKYFRVGPGLGWFERKLNSSIYFFIVAPERGLNQVDISSLINYFGTWVYPDSVCWGLHNENTTTMLLRLVFESLGDGLLIEIGMDLFHLLFRSSFGLLCYWIYWGRQGGHYHGVHHGLILGRSC